MASGIDCGGRLRHAPGPLRTPAAASRDAHHAPERPKLGPPNWALTGQPAGDPAVCGLRCLDLRFLEDSCWSILEGFRALLTVV